MAGTEVRVSVEIWGPEPGFSALTVDAQWAYFLLVSQRATSMIGTLPLTPRRWASRAMGADEERVLRAIAELEAAGFAAMDEATGEVWARPMFKPLGPKQLHGALTTAAGLESSKLRAVVGSWLNEVGPAVPGNARATAFASMRLAVYRRDGYACQYCGWSTNVPEGYDGSYALAEISRNGSPDSYRVTVLELDHVYPDMLGGPFEVDNLQALCSTCNARKGARV